jgi:hypothetical protein
MWYFFRSKYADGRIKPLLRGWIHAIFSIVLISMFFSITIRIILAKEVVETKYIKFSLFLLGKSCSYVSSATYHLNSSLCIKRERKLLFLDLITIPIAFWAPSGVFTVDMNEWKNLFIQMIIIIFVNAFLVSKRNFIKYWNICRILILLVYYIKIISFIGKRYGYKDVWISGSICYLLAFVVSPPLHHNYGVAKWHSKWNSWHEDFHILLAIADIQFIWMCIKYINEEKIIIKKMI